MSEYENSNDAKINLARALDIEFWCEELNLRAEELKDIVKLVGPSIHDIRMVISKRLMSSFSAAY